MYNKLWLNYEYLEPVSKEEQFIFDCVKTFYIDESVIECPIKNSIIEEIKTAVLGITKTTPCLIKGNGVKDAKEAISLSVTDDDSLTEEGYRISSSDKGFEIKAFGMKGLLYGVFRFFNLLRSASLYIGFFEEKIPSNNFRMLNHWDNMTGDIERGYSGDSFFFKDNKMIVDDRIKMYARAVASVGINRVVINNVNVKGEASYLISEKHYGNVRKLSEIFDAYGITLFLSINYALPMENGIDNADPLNEEVIDWWAKKCDEIYENVPLLGGFLVKADSEGRPGPFTYQRTQADGANMLARALAPHGGVVIWRCFVYNCRQDWRDTKTDRARAGYDYFHSLDGEFLENVVLQIKNGPMDFQVREPVSPLFGGMEKTNQMLEVQIAQEYTGQQRHVCYLIPWFKEILAFNTHLNEATVGDIVGGKTFNNKNCGMAAVCNTGNDDNWTGHDLAMANLYGFGRLAFDTSLSAEKIASEWIRLYFANAVGEDGFKKIKGDYTDKTISGILMKSWPTYEKYNAPLGIGWMVTPGCHYGPDVDGYEYSVWGTYHKADCEAIGIDRTGKGTGFTEQYREENRKMYESIDTCPEELLLFFHRMPYNYVLKSGKTIIQHIYDTHFEGSKEVENMYDDWQSLKGIIDDEVFERVTKRLEHQKEHSKEWRDVINSYFWRKTKIADELGRTLY